MNYSRLLLVIIFPVCLLALLIFTLETKASPAATFTVNSTADAVDVNPGNGVCETAVGNGVCTLRAAVMEANAFAGVDTIQLGNATYTLSLVGAGEDQAMSGDLDIYSDLFIIGLSANQTIINGNQTDRIFEINATVSISGTTLTQGAAPSAEAGGAVINYGTLTIQNSTLISNTAQTENGGAIASYISSSTNLVNTTISNNSATQGGGIYSSGAITLTKSVIDNNIGFLHGGGIHIDDGKLFVQDSTISNNETNPAGSSFGGAIYYFGGFSATEFLTVTRSTINHNQAGTVGGIYVTGNSPAHIENSTIAHNSTVDTNNGSSSAIRVSFSNLSILNSTIVNNVSGSTGSDGAVIAGAVSFITVANSIIANNAGGNCYSFGIMPGDEGVFVSNGNNLSDDSSCNFNQPSDLSNTDPLLDPLQNNGGNTNTLALKSSSPAIDAGNNATCPATDQRGVTRPLDGDNKGTAVCDIGAYEYEPANFNQYLYLPVVVKP